jgi:hypothetical protein
MLRYSPRQITLLPGAAQVVRIMLRRPAGLAPGEYRSHLYFEKLAGAGGATSVEQRAAGTEQQIGVVLNMLVGASIPVIVRHATSPASVALAQLALQQPAGATAQLAFQIERRGDSSVYGDISASFITEGGVEHPLGKAAGIAIYTPNPLRQAALSLQVPPGVALEHGKVRLAFHERASAGGKLLAEASLPLP